MKIKTAKNSIELVPEDKYDLNILKMLKMRHIKSIQFEDAWKETGPLIIEFSTQYDWI